MPKPKEKRWFIKQVHFPGEYDEIVENARKCATIDPEIQSRITAKTRKNGMDSLIIQVALRYYIRIWMPKYLQSLKDKKLNKINTSNDSS